MVNSNDFLNELAFRDLVSFSAIRRWRLVLAGCLGLLFLSLFAWFQITRREEPSVDMPGLSVVMAYPGATPEDVETQVVRPLEEVLYGLEGVEFVECSAVSDGASFRVKFTDGVNMDVAAEKVRGVILGKKRDLPAEVKDPEVIKESNNLTPQVLVAVAGIASDTTLNAEAKRLKADLATVPGVSGIDLKGNQKPAVRVKVDSVRLAQHGLSTDQVARAVQGANARVPGGEYKVGPMATLLQVNQPFGDAKSVTRVPVGASVDARGSTQTLLLGDVAEVMDETLTHKERFLYRGQPGVALEVRFRADSDAVSTGKALRARLEDLKKTVPKGLSIVIVHDQPRWISRSVDSFTSSLLEGILLVLFVVTLGMGWRSALVVSTVIPLAAGAAVLGLMLLGFSLEMVSLAGLIVALGLLVDDAVVVTESVQLMRDKGLGPVRAAVYGTSRVFWANNGTTAVAVVSFLPLLFMGEDIGKFIRGLPVAVALALGTSLLVAQVVTPWISTLLLRKKKGVAEIPDNESYDRKEDRSHGQEERSAAMAWLRRLYARYIPLVLSHPGKVALGATALLAAALALFPYIGFQFFPKSDKPILHVVVQMAPGTHLEPTTDKVREVMGRLGQDPAVVEVSAVAGGSYPRIMENESSATGVGRGEILVRLKDGQDTAKVASRLRMNLGNVMGVKLAVKEIWLGPPVEYPIQVRIYGEDYVRLRALAEETKTKLRQIPGTVNIKDSLSDSLPLTKVELDADRALRRGLSPAQVGQTLRTLHGEDKLTEFRRGDDLVEVILDGHTDAARPYGSLEDTPIPNASGQLVPLREAGRATYGHGYVQLQRRNGRRVVEITSDVDAATLPSKVLDELDPWLKSRSWEPGYGFVYAGEQEEVGKSFTNLGVAAMGALVLIAVLLLLMFDSFVLAGLVVMLVPFALIGALAGLALTGNPFGFMAFLGLIALIGVYVNHKIYFIDRMQELLRRGDSLEDAILHAGLDRLRPVVLTALTAVLGLLPLTLGGGPMWGAFGWVNVFGLVASIPLSLILLPAFIVLANRVQARLSRTV